MKYCRPFVCLIVLALALLHQPGRADITPINYSPPPSGGAVSPKSRHPSIRLDDQEVTIRLKPTWYAVDATFHLFNTADTSTEWIGFPKNATGRWPGPKGRIQDFIRFDVWVNGEKVPFADEPDASNAASKFMQSLGWTAVPHSKWMIGQATFPGHGTTTIRVTYEVHYCSCGWLCQKADYIYGTGSYWKGNIGKATFIVDSTQKAGAAWEEPQFGKSTVKNHLIHRRLLSEHVALYEIRDFEPSPESALTIRFSQLYRGWGKEPNELIEAAMNNRVKLVSSLLESGLAVDSKGLTGATALMKAAGEGHLDVVSLLVDKGADVNLETKSGWTALKAALAGSWRNGDHHAEVARFLRDHGATVPSLAIAAFAGDMDAVKHFLAAGSKINARATSAEPTPLVAAIAGGRPEVVALLLDNGADANAKDSSDRTALMAAAMAGHTEMVRMLLDRGADVNAQDRLGQSALNRSVWLNTRSEVPRLLLERGADVNQRGYEHNQTILMHASQFGLVDSVKLLLEKGADVNARDENGKTALSLLLEKDPAFRPPRGDFHVWTMPRKKEFDEIERLLKAHGAEK